MKYYAGIGSRKTPKPILDIMTRVASWLEKQGYILRSGGANGADSAFEAGVANNSHKEIFLPWKGFNGKNSIYLEPARWTYDIAKDIHPAWNKLTNGAKKLHARNVHQIMGPSGKEYSEFVIYWTPNIVPSGGTTTAIKLAKILNILTINLRDPNELNNVINTINKKGDLL